MLKLDRNEQNLVTIQGFYSFACSLAGIFVTVFLFKHGDVKTTVLYNGVFIAGLLFWYVAAGLTLKRFSSATLMRFGIGCQAALYLLLFLLKDGAIQYVVPLGAIAGMGSGTFWAGFNLNQYVFTTCERRVRYFGSAIIAANLLNAVAPFVGGSVIYAGTRVLPQGLTAGYALLFFLVFLVFLGLSLMVGHLPKHEPPIFSLSHIVRHKRSRRWKFVLYQQAVLGLYDVSLWTVSGLLTYLIARREFTLGVLQTAACLLGVLGGFLAVRLLEKKNNYYWIGVGGHAVSIAIFAVFQNLFGWVCFTVLSSLTSSLLYTWLSTVYFQTLDEQNTHWSRKYHMIVERDIALGIPRIISYALLYLFIQSGDQVRLAQTWLFAVPILPILLGILLKPTTQKVAAQKPCPV